MQLVLDEKNKESEMKTGDELTITQYENGWKVDKAITWKQGKQAQLKRDENEYSHIYHDFDAMFEAVTGELSSTS